GRACHAAGGARCRPAAGCWPGGPDSVASHPDYCWRRLAGFGAAGIEPGGTQHAPGPCGDWRARLFHAVDALCCTSTLPGVQEMKTLFSYMLLAAVLLLSSCTSGQ